MSEFLWGYEEELACLDTLDENESDYDPFSSFGDDFFTEEEDKHDYEYQNIGSSDEIKSFRSKSNFRRDDGKCMFGALVEKNDTWEKPVTMMTGMAIWVVKFPREGYRRNKIRKTQNEHLNNVFQNLNSQ